MENHVKVYGDYGYESECLLHECNTVGQATAWLARYTRNGDMGGYKVLEIATFAEDGEYITQLSVNADDIWYEAQESVVVG